MVSTRYTILHRDKTLLVVDKAAGVLTVGHGDTTERCLLDDLRADGLAAQPIHRLDRETSGTLLLCLDARRRADLEQLFRKRRVRKEYLALVHGIPAAREAEVDIPIKDLGATARVDPRGRRAVTRYRVEQVLPRAALLRIWIETGRHNQIRLHLAHLGHPVIGDRKFGRRGASIPGVRRTLLHAAALAFAHPVTGAKLLVRAPLPADMAERLGPE